MPIIYFAIIFAESLIAIWRICMQNSSISEEGIMISSMLRKKFTFIFRPKEGCLLIDFNYENLIFPISISIQLHYFLISFEVVDSPRC